MTPNKEMSGIDAEKVKLTLRVMPNGEPAVQRVRYSKFDIQVISKRLAFCNSSRREPELREPRKREHQKRSVASRPL